MTSEKYENVYEHMKLNTMDIQRKLNNLEREERDPRERAKKWRALTRLLKRTVGAAAFLLLILLPHNSEGQTIVQGELLLTIDKYFLEIHDYVDGRWQWENYQYFEYGQFGFYVDKYDQMNWRVITCEDTTYYSIFGAPERTKIDTAVPVDGGYHTIGENPNPLLK